MPNVLTQIRARSGLDQPEWRAFLLRWLAIGLALRLLAAIFSTGYYDLDEHFQVIEFLGQWMGRSRTALMPWEFAQQQRPWIQPLFYAVIAKGWQLVGVESVRAWMTSFRLFSSLMGWVAMSGLSLCTYGWLTQDRFRRWAVRMLAALWFLPYLDARTSSESFSGALFFIGLSGLQLTLTPQGLKRSIAWALGFVFALAGYSRYQNGPMLLGIGLWMICIAHLPWRSIAWMLAGSSAALAFGLTVDRIGYGFWTCSPWNHLNTNVLQNFAAQHFGAQPWWFYIYFIGEYLPILSAPLGIAIAGGWLARPKHVLTWSTFTQFAILSFATSHKELRFIFSMSAAAPVLAVFAFERLARFKRVDRPMQVALGIATAVNLVVLAVATLKPSSAQPELYTFVFDRWPALRELHYIGPDPFSLGGVPVQFYSHPGFATIQESGWEQMHQALKSHPSDFWLFHDYFELPLESGSLREHCRLEYSVFPSWLKNLMFIPGIRDSACKWSVFRCSNG